MTSYQKECCFLGESHYQKEGGKSSDQNFTQEVVKSYVSGQWNHRFFTSISRIASGLSAWETRSKRHEIWQKISFYNYIQSIVGTSSRDKLCKEKVKQSESAFFEMLSTMKPTHVVVLSKRMWPLMPEGYTQECSDERVYYHSGGSCHALGLKHPSGGGFKAQECRQQYLKFLASN